MSDNFSLDAQSRADQGKGASRRLRRESGLVPAVIYGGDKPAESISLSHKDLIKATENEAFFAHIISLSVDGTAQDVIVKDLQRHPSKPFIMHADFQRVASDKPIHVNVPLHFINEETCIGVKQQGGRVTHAMTELEVICLPKDLPEFIEVDLKKVEAGQSLHISDLQLPAGVESVALNHGPEHDLAVAAVIAAKGGADSGESAEEE